MSHPPLKINQRCNAVRTYNGCCLRCARLWIPVSSSGGARLYLSRPRGARLCIFPTSCTGLFGILFFFSLFFFFFVNIFFWVYVCKNFNFTIPSGFLHVLNSYDFPTSLLKKQSNSFSFSLSPCSAFFLLSSLKIRWFQVCPYRPPPSPSSSSSPLRDVCIIYEIKACCLLEVYSPHTLWLNRSFFCLWVVFSHSNLVIGNVTCMSLIARTAVLIYRNYMEKNRCDV